MISPYRITIVALNIGIQAVNSIDQTMLLSRLQTGRRTRAYRTQFGRACLHPPPSRKNSRAPIWAPNVQQQKRVFGRSVSPKKSWILHCHVSKDIYPSTIFKMIRQKFDERNFYFIFGLFWGLFTAKLFYNVE